MKKMLVFLFMILSTPAITNAQEQANLSIGTILTGGAELPMFGVTVESPLRDKSRIRLVWANDRFFRISDGYGLSYLRYRNASQIGRYWYIGYYRLNNYYWSFYSGSLPQTVVHGGLGFTKKLGKNLCVDGQLGVGHVETPVNKDDKLLLGFQIKYLM